MLFQPSHEVAGTIDKTYLLYWPTTSLSLSLSTILALIQRPDDTAPTEPCSAWLRRTYAHLYAEAALRTAEHELDRLSSDSSGPESSRDFHPDVPSSLHPVLVIAVLSAYEYCQCRSTPRMHSRANQALTTAMDCSLHKLGGIASEAQRRAWWTTVRLLIRAWLCTRVTDGLGFLGISLIDCICG